MLSSAGKNGADGLDGQNGTDGINGTNGKNARVVILYVLNGGILPEGAPSIYSYGTPIELEEPVFEPYNFEGFYYNADFSGEKVTSLDDDYAYGKVLYAKWSYRITFDDNYTGGELNTLEYYDIDSVNITLKTPVRTGYTFLGWYDNPNYDEQIDCWNTNENKGNVTLYAKWKINEYTITYKDNYGLSPEPVKVEYNTILDETYFPDLSNDDYRFIEWKADDSTVGPSYVITDDVVFTAVIETLIFKVTFIGESTSNIIGILRNNVEKTWTFRAHLGDSLTASELVKSVFDDIGISDYEIGDYAWSYYYDQNFQIFIFGNKSIVDDNFITSDTNFSVITVPSMYFGYNSSALESGILDFYVGLSARETTVRDIYDEELLWIPGYPYGSFNYNIGAEVYFDGINFDIWQAWGIDESSNFQLGPPLTDPKNTYWKGHLLSYPMSLNELRSYYPGYINEGTKKCYGLTYVGSGYWLLIPKQKDDKMIPLKEDIFVDWERLDPDSIPEGYYYDVILP